MCLELLNKHHKEWISIIKKFGEKNYAEDIVQETYIKIWNSKSCDKAIINKEVNKAFVWIALRNNFITFQIEKNKAKKISIQDIKELVYVKEDEMKFAAIGILDKKMHIEINNWHEYDKTLFLLYVTENKSYRVLSKETTISLSSIANTIKVCKNRLKDTCGEDYIDYCNEDYEYI